MLLSVICSLARKIEHFRFKTEIAETLQLESRQDAVRLGAGVSQEPQASHFGWRHAIASILPIVAVSPLRRR
jgi:hypothetical protein